MSAKSGGYKKKKIGERIRERRLELGLSLKNASEAIGISLSQMSRIERGDSSSTSPVIREIARALGMPATWPESDSEPLENYFSPDEHELIKLWRGMDEESRNLIRPLIKKMQTLREEVVVRGPDEVDVPD